MKIKKPFEEMDEDEYLFGKLTNDGGEIHWFFEEQNLPKGKKRRKIPEKRVDVDVSDLISEKINEEVCRKTGKSSADTNFTRKELHEYTGKTNAHTDERCLLVTEVGDEFSCRDTHEKIGEEVHHVTHHSPEIRAFDTRLLLPDCSDRSCKVSYE